MSSTESTFHTLDDCYRRVEVDQRERSAKALRERHMGNLNKFAACGVDPDLVEIDTYMNVYRHAGWDSPITMNCVSGMDLDLLRYALRKLAA